MTTVVVIFVLVYLGMLLGALPFLQLDRTGIAVLGTIALLVTESVSMEEAGRKIHIGWWEHARIGVPVTLTTLGISAAYLLR